MASSTLRKSLLGAATAKYPDSFWAAVQFAWVAVGRRDWNDALVRWDSVLKRFPRTSVTAVGQGETLRELGQIDRSDEILESAIRDFPDDVMPSIHYAWNAKKRGDAVQALSRWQIGKGRFPENEYIAIGEVEALLELSRLAEAKAAVDQALKCLPMSVALRSLRDQVESRDLALKAPAQWVAGEIRKNGIDRALPGRMANPEVLIEITSICNFACTYCVSPMKLREKKQMTMETFRKVLDQVSEITTKPIGLHVDGEPTSHPLFHEMALLVNSHDLPISLATNGSHLDPSFLDIWMDPLISMSTLPEELAKRHPKLNFASYIDRIANYAKSVGKFQVSTKCLFSDHSLSATHE